MIINANFKDFEYQNNVFCIKTCLLVRDEFYKHFKYIMYLYACIDIII